MRKHKHEPFVKNNMKMEAAQRTREFKQLIREGNYSVDIEKINKKNSTLKLKGKGSSQKINMCHVENAIVFSTEEP